MKSILARLVIKSTILGILISASGCIVAPPDRDERWCYNHPRQCNHDEWCANHPGRCGG